MQIYNLRITYPKQDILVAAPDIKACFRWLKNHCDIAGACSYVIGIILWIAAAMVFGWSISAAAWEAYRRAIMALAESYFDNVELVAKYQNYLDLLEWDEPSDEVVDFLQANRDEFNQGVLDKEGRHMNTPSHIYVDDVLIAEIERYMRRALVAVIEAIYVIMGFPDDRYRQRNLAMNKWEGMKVSYEAVLLGLLFNTRKMTVGITDVYRKEVLDLINDRWHPKRKAFTVSDIEKLAGKLGRLGEGARWIFHLMSQIYSSIACALRSNQQYLANTSKSFKAMIRLVKNKKLSTLEEDVRELNYAARELATSVHRCKERYFINKTLKQEIQLLREVLADTSIPLETPIAHCIKRAPSASAWGDACLYGGGFFSIDLRFWWHLEWPEEVKQRTKLFLENNKKGNLISINALEFFCIIMNYAAALVVYDTDGKGDDQHPTLLNWADNKVSINWCNHACKEYLAVRALGRLFCAMMIGSDVGINADYIIGELNIISDEISRLTKASPHLPFDYSSLPHTYPQLHVCRRFHPSAKLLSLLWDALLKQSSLDVLSLSKMKPSELDKLSTCTFVKK